jgi:hypothetical protein
MCKILCGSHMDADTVKIYLHFPLLFPFSPRLPYYLPVSFLLPLASAPLPSSSYLAQVRPNDEGLCTSSSIGSNNLFLIEC